MYFCISLVVPELAFVVSGFLITKPKDWLGSKNVTEMICSVLSGT